MSAPDTDVKKQTRRHPAPLIAFILGLVAIVVFFGLSQLSPDNDATEAGATVDATG
jgi:hypothetical protein